MGYRTRRDVLAEVDAAERRQIYLIAKAVRIGMATGPDYSAAMAALELTRSRADNVKEAWDSLTEIGKG